MHPLIGRDLEGRYRLVAELGEGAMGKVFRADRLDGSGPVAVKVLNDDCSEDPALRERFEREARALFGLSHPHILDVQDYGVLDGRQPYLVMELLEGQSLDAMVDEGGLDPAAALEVGRQLLVGLAHAHAQGVLHRDLKSENVFVVRRPDGGLHAKLLDFGLVKFVDDERWGEGKKLTVAGSVMGSPAYMSPEQGTGGPMDARSDVYSAGVVLYELLTGSWPFEAESRIEMLKAHLIEAMPPLASKRSGLRVHPDLEALLRKALAKEREDRYADAVEMLAALDAVPHPAAYMDPAAATRGTQPAGSLPAPPMSAAPALPPIPAAAPLPSPPAATSPAMSPLTAAPIPAPSAAPAKRSLLPIAIAGVLVGACLLGGLITALALFLR